MPIRVSRLERESAAGPIRGLIARIDLGDPAVQLAVTPPTPSTVCEARLVTTDQWSAAAGVTLACNANYFAVATDTPSNPGCADILGLSVSDGRLVSPVRAWGGRPDPALSVGPDNRARVAYVSEDESLRSVTAVAGIGPSESAPEAGTLLVDGGRNEGDSARVDPHKRHPRTAAGVADDGRTLWLVVIDGRQPEWSVGMTLPELADLMIELGATDAVNLDGGGSSSFWYRPDSSAAPIVNRPSDGRFRPVANHIGVRIVRTPSIRSSSARH